MKPTIKLFSLYILFLIITIALASCNSVKKVLNDPIKFEKVAKEVVKRGYCINDTITISKDSIQYINKDSIIRDTLNTPCPDFITKTSNGATVSSKNGLMTVIYPIKTKEKHTTKTITNNIRDKKLESILKAERDSLSVLYSKSQSDLKDTQSELKKAKRKNTFTWIGIIIVILLGIGLKTGILKKFIPFL